jgi:hypothetical protein
MGRGFGTATVMGAGGASTTLGGVISRTGAGMGTGAGSGGRTTIALDSGLGLGFGGGS